MLRLHHCWTVIHPIVSLESYRISFSTYGGNQNCHTGDLTENIGIFFYTRLTTQTMIYLQRCFRQTILENTTIVVYGHYPPFCFYLKHNVSETGFCLHLHVEPTQLGPVDRASPYLQTPAPTQDRVYKTKNSINHLQELRRI
jgi:hypothetical protein